MKKIFIKNRNKAKLSVLIEESQPQKGLAFIMHGLGGFKEQPHIQIFAEAFKEGGYTVVRFDAANTLGESEGKYENATITNYNEDLEDVINWAKGQSWYQEPFVLAGHSLGSICVALYAENNPDEVLALAPISTVVSGQLSVEAHKKEYPEIFKKWRETGWKIEESHSKPGVMKKLPWSHIKDRLKYDLLIKADKLTMPVLLIVGEKDPVTPHEHQKVLFDKLPGKKELHIIKGASHSFRNKNELDEIKNIFLNWIKNL